MDKINQKDAIEIFSSPKKTMKLLDKYLKKDEAEIFITSQQQGFYSLFDKDKFEVCTSSSVYNSLIGLLYYAYGVGKSDNPLWAMFEGENENNFENMLENVESPNNMFSTLERAIDSGGTFYYNSSKNLASFKLPEELNFNQDIVIKSSTFSDCIHQMDSTLSVLAYENNLEQ